MKRGVFYIGCLVVLLTACKSNEPTNTRPEESQKEVVSVVRMPKSTKKGVAFSINRQDDLLLLSSYISWNYNWANTPWDLAADWFDVNNVDFCPMCWNGSYSPDRIRAYVAAHPKTKYLLAFNEPNLTDQANMTPTQAAALWNPVVALAKELGLKLVSPAMNYGTLAGYSNPIKWLDEFFSQPNVSIDDIAAISVHCYMTSPEALINYIEMFAKYNKPIWLTEFCAWWDDSGKGSAEQQVNYMSYALNYLEQSSLVQRYAWFIPRYKSENSFPYMQLLTNGSPSELTKAGNVYCMFSSFDKNVYMDIQSGFDASQYIATSDYDIQIRPSTDSYEGLMIQALAQNQWIEYQISLSQDASQVQFRYSTLANTTIAVYIDGVVVNTCDLIKTNSLDDWETASCACSLTKGTHKLKIVNMSTMFNLSRISL